MHMHVPLDTRCAHNQGQRYQTAHKDGGRVWGPTFFIAIHAATPRPSLVAESLASKGAASCPRRAASCVSGIEHACTKQAAPQLQPPAGAGFASGTNDRATANDQGCRRRSLRWWEVTGGPLHEGAAEPKATGARRQEALCPASLTTLHACIGPQQLLNHSTPFLPSSSHFPLLLPSLRAQRSTLARCTPLPHQVQS